MSAARPEKDVPPAAGRLRAGDMLELVLSLSAGQVELLEKAARRRGLTTGALLRRLVSNFLDRDVSPEFNPPSE